jgi:hypothetical protein
MKTEETENKVSEPSTPEYRQVEGIPMRIT